jgi:hypothetical protein
MGSNEIKKPICKTAFILLIILLGIKLCKAQTTLLVGSGETYTTISGAYAACTNGATNYIIEIRSTYTNTEAKPITLGANTALSVTIRPQAGVGAFTLGLVAGTETSIFNFTGGDNITIDGRAGGAGSSILTIENTQTAASKYAIQFSGGSTGNTIKYCTIKGSNSNATASATSSGVIMFGSGTNSTNTIDYCTIKQSGSNYPAVCVNSYDATNNNQISITNCNLVNFKYYGIWANGANNDNWTITGNSFYADYAQSGWANVVYMLHIADGTGYTITGNYFGGRAALCGGLAYTLSTSSSLIAIYVANCDAGSITISGNYIQNIALTSTFAGNQWAPFYIAAGAANFTIGSAGAGNDNTIGATSGTANIVCTDNAANSASAVQYFIGSILSTGTSTIEYNTVGAVTFNGSNVNVGKKIYGMYLDKGTLTFSNNTFGNTTSNNIILSPNAGAITYIIYVLGTSLGTTTTNSNIFRNIQNNAAAGAFNIVSALNQLTCNGNTFSGISSASSAKAYQSMIYFLGTEAVIITNNVVKALTFTHSNSEVAVVYINNVSATVDFSFNTIGESGTANDISLAGSDIHRGVLFSDCGDITCNSNTFQNFNGTSTGTGSRMICVHTGSPCDGTNTFTGNYIDNLTCAGAGTYALYSNYYLICGMYLSGNGTNLFSRNTITDLAATTTSAVTDLWVIGMQFLSASGTVTVEKNRITGLTHKGTIGGGAARIVGVRSTADGSSNYYNNVIILDNGANTNDMTINGFYIATTLTGTHNFYHNTVKIAGTTSGTAARAAWYSSSTTGTHVLRNNIFQNLSTGGSGLQYAIQKSAAGTTWTETNNYLEASTIGNWEGATKTTFANWQGVSGTNDKSSTITIASTGVVPAATSSDVQNTGFDMDAIVPTDIDGNARHATTPYMGAYEALVALPIKLLNFTAKAVAKLVEIRWTTVTEINNDYFTVERSADGIKFKSIAVKKGAGNSSSRLNYMDTDIRPLKGVSYYRLKQTDFDGKFSYSHIVAVKFSELNELKVSPNPTEHDVNLSFFSPGSNHYTFKIFDDKGSLVKSESYITAEGMNTLTVDLSRLNRGLYFIFLSSTEGLLKARIVKE